MNETRVDRLLGGRLALRQPLTGHRAGTDALLVAAAAVAEPGAIVADVGSGVGTIGLALALREPTARVRLIEREAGLAALAQANVELNGLGDRVAVSNADLFDRAALKSLLGRTDLVASNPPFYAAGSVRASPYPLKARAHGLDQSAGATHEGWLRAMLALLQPHGRLVLIHRPEALAALLAAAEGRLGALSVLPVLPRAGQPAIRILVGGIAASRAPLRILAPLALHEADGAATPLAHAVAQGEAALPLLDGSTRKSRPVGPASS